MINDKRFFLMKRNSKHFGSTHRTLESTAETQKESSRTQNNKAFPCEEASLPAPNTTQKLLHFLLLDVPPSVRQALEGEAWELSYKL